MPTDFDYPDDPLKEKMLLFFSTSSNAQLTLTIINRCKIGKFITSIVSCDEEKHLVHTKEIFKCVLEPSA